MARARQDGRQLADPEPGRETRADDIFAKPKHYQHCARQHHAFWQQRALEDLFSSS